MSHVTSNTYNWVMSHVTHMNESYHTYELVMSHRIMSHTWLNYVKHINESCHIQSLHIWLSHVTHMNDSCHTYEWVMSHQIEFVTPPKIRMATNSYDICHATHMTDSYHTCDWVMPHIWMSYVTFNIFAHQWSKFRYPSHERSKVGKI